MTVTYYAVVRFDAPRNGVLEYRIYANCPEALDRAVARATKTAE